MLTNQLEAGFVRAEVVVKPRRCNQGHQSWSKICGARAKVSECFCGGSSSSIICPGPATIVKASSVLGCEGMVEAARASCGSKPQAEAMDVQQSQ